MAKDEGSYFMGFGANLLLGFFLFIAVANIVMIIQNTVARFVLAVIIFIGLEAWAIIYMWKRKKKFAIGMIAGIIVPLLVFGSCVMVLRNALG